MSNPSRKKLWRVLLLSVVAAIPAAAQPFHIVLNADAGLAANGNALAAFNRAAARWESYFTDPITITIQAGLATFANPNTIGSTSAVFLYDTYDVIRDMMVADAADESDDGIVAFLPTAATFSAFVKTGTTINGFMGATKANLKAMGFPDLDADFGVNDATITFNSDFAFDYDNSDGVGAGLIDFETTAIHEIGHALGFISTVDGSDGGETSLEIFPLDLFRFRNNGAFDPATNVQFATYPRDLVPGSDDIFDDITTEVRFSTGVIGGDGRQASHWKDDALTGVNLGVMDPTLNFGVAFDIGQNDLRALDLIGYDYVPVPEASCALAALLGIPALLRRRRR